MKPRLSALNSIEQAQQALVRLEIGQIAATLQQSQTPGSGNADNFGLRTRPELTIGSLWDDPGSRDLGIAELNASQGSSILTGGNVARMIDTSISSDSTLREATNMVVSNLESSDIHGFKTCVSSSHLPFLTLVMQQHLEIIRSAEGVNQDIAFYNNQCDPFSFDLDGSVIYVRDAIFGVDRQFDLNKKEQKERVREILMVSLIVEVLAILAALAMVFLPPATQAVIARLTAQIESNPGSTRIILEIAETILRKDWSTLLVLVKNAMNAGALTGFIVGFFAEQPWWMKAIIVTAFIAGIVGFFAGGPFTLGMKIAQLGFMTASLSGKVYGLTKGDSPVIEPPWKGKGVFPPRAPFPLPARPPLPAPLPPPPPGEAGGGPIPDHSERPSERPLDPATGESPEKGDVEIVELEGI